MSRHRQLAQTFHVPHRRLAEVPLVISAEMRLVFVTDAISRLARVEVLAQHQPPGFLKPQVLLKLQRAHRRHRLEVGVEPGRAHAQFPRHVLDPQRLVKVLTKFLDSPLMALDKSTGKPVWKCAVPEGPTGDRGFLGTSGAAYASVIAVDFENVRQYVQLTATTLVGVAASDGKLL